ncbi:gpi-anchored cell wall organization protein ecm33 [Colletotrichum kahawae]|uniref:Gpi-anchored cell wall organization protein ecm33 n=1 Tax=Colletotrichum kahawae TaxID=34407 RepID=A0AAE0DA60_COLKA|nr:gpi-anchored cell wall organization protein ecm33 [Colletotrichum kahawae]
MKHNIWFMAGFITLGLGIILDCATSGLESWERELISSQDEADLLSNCDTISGRFLVATKSEESRNVTISLPNLVRVNGTLSIGNVTSFSAPKLREVTGSLSPSGRDSLPLLETVGQTLFITMTGVPSISFPSLVRIGSFFFDEVYGLKSIKWGPVGFPVITERSGNIRIHETDIENIDWIFNKDRDFGTISIHGQNITKITVTANTIDELYIAGYGVDVGYEIIFDMPPVIGVLHSMINTLSLSGVRSIKYIEPPSSVGVLSVERSSMVRLDIPFRVSDSLSIRENQQLANLFYGVYWRNYGDASGRNDARSIYIVDNPALVMNFNTTDSVANESTGAWRWPQSNMDTLVMKDSKWSTGFFNGLLEGYSQIERFEVDSYDQNFSCRALGDEYATPKGGKSIFTRSYSCEHNGTHFYPDMDSGCTGYRWSPWLGASLVALVGFGVAL